MNIENTSPEVLITIARPAHGSPGCWYNERVGQSFRATYVLDESDPDTEYYKICDDEPIVEELGIGSLWVCNVQGYIPDYDINEIK